MRFAVRNLGAASYGGNSFARADAVAASLGSVFAFQPDVVLLQEVPRFSLELLPAGWRAAPHQDASTSWGSVVAVAPAVVADLNWRPTSRFLDSLTSYVDFARVQVDGAEVAVASVHAPPKWRADTWAGAGGTGPVPTGWARPWCSDPLLDDLLECVGSAPALLGGDWNEAPNCPADDDEGTTEWFRRTGASGWSEVVAGVFGGPVRTNFGRNTKRPYQNDHVFVSPDIRERVTRVLVWNEPAPGLTDHAGIAVDLGERRGDSREQ